MTPKEAVKHFIEEFVGRFNCDAESCTDFQKTHEAMDVLMKLVELPPEECPGGYCKGKH